MESYSARENGIPFYNVDEPGGHHSKWSKAVNNEKNTVGFTYVSSLEESDT